MPLHHAGCMSEHHEHDWQEVSRHRTSTGVVTYLGCSCGRWQLSLVESSLEESSHIYV
ncbi:hypothetical protein SAMN04490220_6659 [Rhodococcus jostii]|uniref:Uncharacterized protein n=1 Tax=Rhodococcus jostii TaxID=132919 RepID=A0A1H5G4L3_RHOJO|nr:hypothetical protein SAMN04490220_6659 [Rhodococcus jostii]